MITNLKIRPTILALSFLLVPALITPPLAPRPVTEKDLLRFVWIADASLSPDGAQVVFTRVTANEKDNGYDTELWIVPADASGPARRFTAGPRDGSPRWSPDSKSVAFVRAPAKDAKPQIYIISLAGGEARAITSLPQGAGSPAWSPDSKSIAFTSTTTYDDLAKAKDKSKADSAKSDVRVFTRAAYRSNDQGYLDPTRHSHIWTVAVPKPADDVADATPLTSSDYDEQNIQWSPDGTWIYFTSNQVPEPYYEAPDADLYWVPARGGAMTKVASIDGTIGPYAFSPDGKSIAFRGTQNGRPIRSYNQPDLFVVENRPGAMARNLTEKYDYDVGAGLTGDQRAPRGGQPGAPVWSPDGKSVFVVTAEEGRANLASVDVVTGAVTDLTQGNREVVSYAADARVNKMVALISTATEIGDLYGFDPKLPAPGKLQRLTSVNQALFAELKVTEPEEFWSTSFDGKKIQGWILKPPDFDATKQYPMILEIHGGPHSAYGYTFTHEFLWMAAKGYVVVYLNPRGSTSYGQDFGNIIQYHYPGDDYRDLMAGVDEVVKRPFIDSKKLGVTGGSGGGLLTNWTVTQTTRFAAAVSQRDIADWAGFWFSADFTLFTPSWFRAPPWEDPRDYADRSPITHIANVKTPLMIVVGQEDYRTPEGDGGEQMFRALKYLRRPTALVQFPGETHELSRSGKPKHRIERLQHIVGWFDKYLLGQTNTAYDVQ